MQIGVYLADGELFLDLSAVGNSKIKIDTQQIFDLLGFDLSTISIKPSELLNGLLGGDKEEESGEALTSDDGGLLGGLGLSTDGDQDLSGIMSLVNSFISGIRLKATPWNIDLYTEYKIAYLGVFFSANLLNDLVSLLLGEDTYSEYAVLDETQSGLFLNFDDPIMINGVTQDMLSLELKLAFANKEDVSAEEVAEDKTYKVDLKLGVNLDVQFKSIETAESLVPMNKRLEFISLDEYLDNIMNIVNGLFDCKYVEEENPSADKIYYTFTEDEQGDHIVKGDTFRKLMKEESTTAQHYTRGYVKIDDGKRYVATFEQPHGQQQHRYFGKVSQNTVA